jgi:8-oxo-dGTP pyrophosphatase MutT (NUDIX family)
LLNWSESAGISRQVVLMAEIIKLAEVQRARIKSSKRRQKPRRKAEFRDASAKADAWEAFKDALLTMPLATEMSSKHATPPAPPEQPQIMESGVLAFRRDGSGDTRILLISRRRSKKWGIPKGKVVPHLSFRDNAIKEAFEEAGVVGSVSPFSVGVFRAKKRRANSDRPEIIEVWVYLLDVEETLPDWPEREKRATRWVSCEAAARQLREPLLAHLCHRLAQN